MKNHNYTLLFLPFLLIFIIACSSVNKEINADWESFKRIGDSTLLNTPTKFIETYAEVDSGIYLKVKDLNAWKQDYLSLINIIENNEIIVYVENPYSESGDYNNLYIHYFDKQGKLIVFIRESSFFNSSCSKGVVTEKTTYVLEADSLTKKLYEIYDENELPIEDTTNCIFNYRFSYDIYKDYFSTPIVKQHK